MNYNSEIHHRRSIRLPNYDYSQEGIYFITICTNDKKCIWGSIFKGEMQLNECGIIVKQCWLDIPNHFINILYWPNHL